VGGGEGLEKTVPSSGGKKKHLHHLIKSNIDRVSPKRLGTGGSTVMERRGRGKEFQLKDENPKLSGGYYNYTTLTNLGDTPSGSSPEPQRREAVMCSGERREEVER